MRLPERQRLPDNLEIPGLYPPRRRLPRWPLGLWLVVALVAAIPMVGIPGVVLAHYTTSSSSFCLTCHGTGDTPDRGVPSEVHPSFDEVSCVDCHAKPGQVVFEGYVKGFMAEPERVTSNCLRCHSAMSQRTDQQGFKFNPQAIAINHQSHLERGATCVSCHANVAHDLGLPKTNRPQMESCYSCHPRTESCMKCHTGKIPAPQPARETIGRRPVAPPQPAATPVAATTQEKPTKEVESADGPKGAKETASPTPAGTPSEAAKPTQTTEARRSTPTPETDPRPSVPTATPPAPKPAAVGGSAEGKALFTQWCAACHGPDGGALPSANLKSRAYLEGYGADALVRATTEGKGGMPPFGAARGGSLQEDQIKAVVAHLLSAAN